MEAKFKVGQTIYLIYQSDTYSPKMYEKVITEVRSRHAIGRDEMVDYLTDRALYDVGDGWYADRDEANAALILALDADIERLGERLEKATAMLTTAKQAQG